MPTNFEATGNISDWPRNEPGKRTQAAIFGLYHPRKGRTCEILWTASFPDLDGAMYWAAKKEIEAVRKGKWSMASRVLWQHDLTPEQAVAAAQKEMAPQLDAALEAAQSGQEIELGEGPMGPVDPAKALGYYVEAFPADEDEDDDDDIDTPITWHRPGPSEN